MTHLGAVGVVIVPMGQIGTPTHAEQCNFSRSQVPPVGLGFWLRPPKSTGTQNPLGMTTQASDCEVQGPILDHPSPD